MKRLIRLMAAAFICGLMFVNCGGSGGSGGGKELDKNEFLGNMPNLIYQQSLIDSIRNAERNEKMSKLDGNSKSDLEKASKIAEKFSTREEKERKAFEAKLEEAKAELLGKDIPYEVENGTGCEITSCKIIGIDGNGVNVKVEVKITDAKSANINRYGEFIDFTKQDMDKDGNPISGVGLCRFDLSGKTDGATGKKSTYISIYGDNIEQYVNFAKLKFIKD